MTIQIDRIADAPMQRVIGLNGTFTADTRSEIPALWAEWDWQAVTGVVGDHVYGISHGFGPGRFDYLCGLPVSAVAPVPDKQIEVTLPAGPHAVFVHDGHVSGIASIFDAVLCNNALGPGWVMARGPQFEVYGEGFDPATATGRVEIWFPVEAA